MAAQVVVAYRPDRGGSPCCACSTEVLDLSFWASAAQAPTCTLGIAQTGGMANVAFRVIHLGFPEVRAQPIFGHEIILGESESVHRMSSFQVT